jgi:hypothetical protein
MSGIRKRVVGCSQEEIGIVVEGVNDFELGSVFIGGVRKGDRVTHAEK